jgi:hypothetical protein
LNPECACQRDTHPHKHAPQDPRKEAIRAAKPMGQQECPDGPEITRERQRAPLCRRPRAQFGPTGDRPPAQPQCNIPTWPPQPSSSTKPGRGPASPPRRKGSPILPPIEASRGRPAPDIHDFRPPRFSSERASRIKVLMPRASPPIAPRDTNTTRVPSFPSSQSPTKGGAAISVTMVVTMDTHVAATASGERSSCGSGTGSRLSGERCKPSHCIGRAKVGQPSRCNAGPTHIRYNPTRGKPPRALFTDDPTCKFGRFVEIVQRGGLSL